MGAWGAGVFANDTAADIRSEYREALEDELPDDAARQRVLEQFSYLLVGDDTAAEFWIALAAAQSQVGRLDDDVRDAALTAINRGDGLDVWAEAGTTELARRQAALQKLRTQLTGPQPASKRVRRPWRHIETELTAGDVLSYTTADGRLVLFRVAGVRRSRYGDAPSLEWLNWSGPELPTGDVLSRLMPHMVPATRAMPRRPLIYSVTRFRRKDATWRDCGFYLAARLPNWPSHDDLPQNFSAGWRALALAADKQPDPVAARLR
ncbi:hypothetical protein ALI44B_05705 [Leifsonia sp. ALI-44-B]|uniref:hypothetical protein n=1 Tax=Leifsonia sp. ALI-44-B TaxID=1933776 RepID=UPI00097CB71B|nr:hypothetical protein [Leifsonia sp. ALI-44-B]ONI64073.1 hypothetical protein ALI44B_05705 [Leifsonia sp. ALI-44-B]